MGILKLADLDFFEAKSVDIDAFSAEYIEWINNSNLLHEKPYKYNIYSDKTFNSDNWILLNENDQGYHILDFNFSASTVNSDDIVLMKCWIASKLMDEASVITLKKQFSFIKKVIETTNNFDSSIINSSSGNVLMNILETANVSSISGLKEYLYFLDDIGHTDECLLDIIKVLDDVDLSVGSNSRRIPYSKDILAFKYYLTRFFEEDNPDVLKKFYMPILLWWKITMVIPMRPTEFAYKLKRDCLLERDGKHYLKIDRVKIKDKSNKVGKIPVLDKIQITKEMFDLVSKYIEITKFDSETKTLISYNAIKFFEKESSELDLDVKVLWNGIMKGDTTAFNRVGLQRLLDSFYTVVINGIYKDEGVSEQLNVGDTRHLAFSSLVMQGLTPIEIAMLGGHRHLHSQDSYTGHVEYYIDSEILDFAGSKNIEKSISDRNLVKLIYSKPAVCPRFIADCYPTEEGIGYCTLDINKDDSFCEDVEHCMFCSKWWCEPTNENYIKAKAFLESNVMSELKKTIEKEEQFLVQLLSNAKTVNVNGLLELDREYEQQVSTARLKLRSSADKMISLTQSLMNYNTENTTIGDISNG